jgi:hypothetical protein
MSVVSVPQERREKPARRVAGGWTVALAALLGALGAVALLPRARSIAAAQVCLALGRRPEWMQAAAGGRWTRLEHVLRTAPDDVALQIGGVTLPDQDPLAPDEDGNFPVLRKPDNHEIVVRLEALARRFPASASVRAHLLSHLSLNAVSIYRPEAAYVGGSPYHEWLDQRLQRQYRAARASFTATAEAGEKLEPENGFFTAMRAVAAFAERRDQVGLHFLHAAAAQPIWEDHASEQAFAQWDMQRRAFGDHGALQRFPAFSRLTMTHLARLREASHMAVWYAWQRERAGDMGGAWAIRRDVIRLGQQLGAVPSVRAYWMGLTLCDIGLSPHRKETDRQHTSWALDARRKGERDRWLAYLDAHDQSGQAQWLRDVSVQMKDLRERRDSQLEAAQAADPFRTLVGWWTVGIVLLRQLGGLLALWGATLLLRFWPRRRMVSNWSAGKKWFAVGLVQLLVPPVLIWVFGLAKHLRDSLMVSLLLAGLLGLAWFSGRRIDAAPGDRDRRVAPSWRTALIAAVSLLPSTLLLMLFRGDPVFDTEFVWRLLRLPIGLEYRAGNPALLLIVLPTLLLAFSQLCRVVALRLPLRNGLVRGIHVTVPVAILLLAFVYLAALVPTVATDRVNEQRLERALRTSG